MTPNVRSMGAPPAVSVAHTTEPMMKKMIAVLVL